jgi:processed acidic surface protein
MKKLGAIILTLSLLLGLYPQTVVAGKSTEFELELTQYLTEISTERGFEVTKDDILSSLAFFDLDLEYFNTIDELRTYLGEVIKADLSNLNSLYEDYSLAEDTLSQILRENGEELNDYIFLGDLNFSLLFYTDDGVFEREPDFDQNLEVYLATISEVRGLTVTKETLEAILSGYGDSLDEFETVKDLGAYLGEVIKADLSNLDTYYKDLGLDKEAILQLLEENGGNINDYVYMFDLSDIIWSNEEETPVIDEEMLNDMLAAFGITKEEIQNIENYFTALEDYYTSPDTLNKIMALGERMMAFEALDPTDAPTQAQMDEMTDIFNEYLSVLKLNLSFSLINDGVETSVSLQELMGIEELQDTDFKLTISGADGQFLADIVITSQMINSESLDFADLIGEATDRFYQASAQEPASQTTTKVVTVKGAKLPKTASDYLQNALIGMLIICVGIMVYRKVRNTEGGNQ